MIGSVLLHVTVAVLLMISWSFTRDLKVGAVVPVTIVSHAPAAEPKPAEQAPVEQPAQAPEPTPAPEPAPPPPAPKPAPAPPKPTPPPPKPAPPAPTPKPVPKVEPKPVAAAPPKPQPQAQAKPQKSLDLDALSASISSLSKSTSAKPAAAAKGVAQAQTSPAPRQTLGAAESAAAIRGLTEELQRRWNPNCEVEGGRDVQVRVTFMLGQGGQVVGEVGSQIRGPATPVARTAADRAVSAVYAAAPFRALPKEFYGEKIAVNFNAREACST